MPIPPPLEYYDDFIVLNNNLTNNVQKGVTLFARMKNERYFVRQFISHYRKLGIKRFVIIDDKSNDGTREYLIRQADCMVLSSEYSYTDKYPIASTPQQEYEIKGTKNIWHNLLLRKYSIDRWAIYADADEFLRLPDGIDINELVELLEQRNNNAAWTVMLDVYPESISKLRQLSEREELDMDSEWFFDGVKHLQFDTASYSNTSNIDVIGRGRPKVIYGGSRARLMRNYGVGKTNESAFRNRLRRLKGKVPKYNSLIKIMLVKVPENGYFRGPHTPFFRINSQTILPIDHYKFCGDLFRRSQYAVSSGAYAEKSREYADMLELLARMQQPRKINSIFTNSEQGTFLFKRSRSTVMFENYIDTENAVGLP